MPRISTDNYDTVASWNGSQDLFVVEQPDGTKVATPAMVKQFMEAGDFEATGEITDGHGNILKDMAKSAIIGDLSQTGLTGDSVADQLGDAKEEIGDLSTVKTGTFTKDSSQSGASAYLSIRQVGKVVSIQGYISGLVVGNTTIGKISGVGFPPVPVRALGNSTNQPWETGDAVHTLIDTDGTLISRITKATLNISITYIV